MDMFGFLPENKMRIKGNKIFILCCMEMCNRGNVDYCVSALKLKKCEEGLLRTLDILDIIIERLARRWPDRPVYMDACPDGFAWPSYCLAVEKDEWTDANRFFVRHDVQMKLTIYDQIGEPADAFSRQPARERCEIMELLAPALQVGSRHLKLDLKALQSEEGENCVQINASWFDDRSETGKEAECPAADSYTLRIREHTNILRGDTYGTS